MHAFADVQGSGHMHHGRSLGRSLRAHLNPAVLLGAEALPFHLTSLIARPDPRTWIRFGVKGHQ